MRRLKANKLKLSKWTAVAPINKEKHFLVTELLMDDQEVVQGCVLEAVISRTEYPIQWRELLEEDKWIQGWK